MNPERFQKRFADLLSLLDLNDNSGRLLSHKNIDLHIWPVLWQWFMDDLQNMASPTLDKAWWNKACAQSARMAWYWNKNTRTISSEIVNKSKEFDRLLSVLWNNMDLGQWDKDALLSEWIRIIDEKRWLTAATMLPSIRQSNPHILSDQHVDPDLKNKIWQVFFETKGTSSYDTTYFNTLSAQEQTSIKETFERFLSPSDFSCDPNLSHPVFTKIAPSTWERLIQEGLTPQAMLCGVAALAAPQRRALLQSHPKNAGVIKVLLDWNRALPDPDKNLWWHELVKQHPQKAQIMYEVMAWDTANIHPSPARAHWSVFHVLQEQVACDNIKPSSRRPYDDKPYVLQARPTTPWSGHTDLVAPGVHRASVAIALELVEASKRLTSQDLRPWTKHVPPEQLLSDLIKIDAMWEQEKSPLAHWLPVVLAHADLLEKMPRPNLVEMMAVMAKRVAAAPPSSLSRLDVSYRTLGALVIMLHRLGPQPNDEGVLHHTAQLCIDHLIKIPNLHGSNIKGMLHIIAQAQTRALLVVSQQERDALAKAIPQEHQHDLLHAILSADLQNAAQRQRSKM